MAIVETILGAVLEVVFGRLASQEVIDFFRRTKFDESLVLKLKTQMLAAEKLLLDAEQKQMTNHAVKQWLDELKHWFYRAEELVNEIAVEALRLSLEKQSPQQPQPLGTKEDCLLRLESRIDVAFDSSNAEHQETLRALWNAAFPGEKLHDLISEQWKEMGWQGKDSSTDFRNPSRIFCGSRKVIELCGNTHLL